VANYDPYVGAMVGTIGAFALTGIMLRFYLGFEKNDTTTTPLVGGNQA